ncbi:MAG: amidohydrolase [Longimicrobiales bacterium]
MIRIIALLGAVAMLTACEAPAPESAADLVLRNGKIVTVDEQRPEAQAVAIAGSTILAVGSDAEIERFVGSSTRVIDLDGRLAVPGFIEGHGHFMGLGEAKLILDLTKASSWDDIVAMVGAAARDAGPGQWIAGRGWHQEKWSRPPAQTVDGVPLHPELSRVSPNNPVLLEHASGHASFVNAKAMEVAGITARTPNPQGGEIVKDAAGQPTGLLRETAQRLASAVFDSTRASRSAEEIDGERRRMVELAGAEALAKGITSFHDAGSDFETIDFFKLLEGEGNLPIRLYVMVRRETNEEMAAKLPQYRMVAEGDDYLAVRSIKRQIDGALGSHGAWLLEPYVDLETSTGLTLETPEDIEGTARIAIQHGFQLNTHAIGDRANREVLNIYERVVRENADKTDLRWRIEHAQHLHPADVSRFKTLGVIAAMQGVHATSDAPWIPRRLGDERARTGAYVWRDLLDAGVIIANGTDVPVEDIDPIASFYSTVSRRTSDGSVFYPDQRLTREEALRTYTLNNAFAAFEDGLKGSISPGKLADIVILSQDILTIPEEQIPATRVDYTILGGRVRYERNGSGLATR